MSSELLLSVQRHDKQRKDSMRVWILVWCGFYVTSTYYSAARHSLPGWLLLLKLNTRQDQLCCRFLLAEHWKL